MSVSFDLTITLSSVIEVTVFGGGGIAALVTLRNAVTGLKDNQATSKKETKEQFDNVQLELKKLGDILIGQARFDEKLTNLDRRVTSQGRQIDEMRRDIRGGRIPVVADAEHP